jgi:hypothetical protein
MSSSKFLRRIAIESPCSARWEEMKGNEQVRFCSHCELNVTDLTQMTRPKAISLVRRSKGRLCLRIQRSPAGELVTRPSVQKLYSISRRASRIAAGTFTALMSISTAAYAQSGSTDPNPQEPPVAQQPIEPTATPDTVIQEPPMLGGVMVMISYEQPLVSAVHFNDLERINELLSEGEDVNEAEADGTNALDLAVANGNVEIVQRLLSAGADVNAPGAHGGGALFSLDASSSLELLEVLISAGARVDQIDSDGNTPLMNAAEWDDAELVQALISAGAYVNARNKVGNTALMVAAEQGNATVVKALLDAGAIYGLQNDEGFDALALARANDNDEIADLLRDAGAIDIAIPAPEEK